MSDSPRRPPIDIVTIVLVVLALASAIAGQSQVAIGPGDAVKVSLWWIVAAALFAILILYRERPGWLARLIDQTPESGQMALIWIAAACSLFAVALIIHAENVGRTNYGDVFLAWAIAVGLILIAAARRPRTSLKQFIQEHRADVLALALFTGLAAVLRFVLLGALPAVVGGDEGLLGMAGVSVSGDAFATPFGTFHGAGTLYIHTLRGMTSLFGQNAFGLRAISALAGTLAVPAVYLLGRELAGRRVGGVAALYMAVSHYHVHFSRMVAVTYLQGTFYNTLALYLLISGLRRQSSRRLMLSGLVIGVYFLIYLDARLFLATMAAVVAALAIIDWPLVRRNLRRLLLAAIVFAIVAAPMLLWAARHPGEFSARFTTAGAFAGGMLDLRVADTGEDPVQLITETALQAFMTLIATPVVDFFFGNLPVLNVVSSILFLFGLVYSLLHLRHTAALVSNVWLWSGIAAIAIFTVDPFAAGYRLLTVFPAVCILIGLGLDRIIDMLHLPGRAAISAVGGVAMLMAALNLNAYFLNYLPSCRYGGDFATRFQSRLGQYLANVDRSTKVYLLTVEGIEAGTHPSLDFLSGGMKVSNVKQPLADAPPFDATPPSLFVAVPDRTADLDTLAQTYPGGQEDVVFDCDTPVFAVYRLDDGRSN